MEYLYLLVLKVADYFGDMYKEEIKAYFNTFKFSEQWFAIVMLAIAICSVALTILIVTYR